MLKEYGDSGEGVLGSGGQDGICCFVRSVGICVHN